MLSLSAAGFTAASACGGGCAPLYVSSTHLFSCLWSERKSSEVSFVKAAAATDREKKTRKKTRRH